MPNNDTALYDSLKELGVIPEKALDAAYTESQKSKVPLETLLLKAELISDKNLGKLVADQFGIPFITLKSIKISKEVLDVIPEIVAKKQQIIAFQRDKDGLKVGMRDPQNTEEIKFIEKKVGIKVTPHYITQHDFEEAMGLYRKELQQTFDEMLKGQVDEAGKATAKEAPVSKIVDTLIQYAHRNKASDIHIEPEDEISLVRFRVDGVLHDVLELPKDIHNQITSRIKVLSKLRTDEHLSAQDGKMQITLEMEDLDIRVSIVPIVEGEKAVLRLLSSRSRRFSLQELGMRQENLTKVAAAYKSPNGMILTTGPTGSGKTTSIYAILKALNKRGVNISTIEDPVEYDIEGINQIQVNPKTNLTFADGLRSILRQDPDIIFVGEIRDKETAGIATNSAMTGHLVLSTLHTNDAATTLPRLIDMEIEPFLVASTVNVIIAQRLVRKICEQCRISKTIHISDLTLQAPPELLAKYLKGKEEIRAYEGKGCEVCHDTGYVGRTGLFEVLQLSPAIKKLITSKESAGVIEEKAKEEGMTTMFEDGIQKVLEGKTTIEEIMRVTNE